MKVLISAYGCEPERGSEPGVGWNWVMQMSKYHEVWTITRANNQECIEKELSRNPVKNLHFVYFDLPKWARWWKKGGRGVQLYYFLWQICAYPLAKRLHKEVSFEMCHHVTFATFRQPSFLAFLPIPFIWGPVGGGERAPVRFYRQFGLRGAAGEIARDLYNFFCRLSPLVRLTMKKANLILVTTEDTKKVIPKKYYDKTLVYPTIGIEHTELNGKISGELKGSGTFKVLYAGRLVSWKGITLALESFIKLHSSYRNSTMTIIGDGPESKRLKKLVQKAGLQDLIKFTGSLNRSSTLDAYMNHDVFLFPSFHDSGAMVILEAMAACIPVVCLALGGPSISVADGCGFKIEPHSYNQLINDITDTLLYIYNCPEEALKSVLNARKRLEEYFLWDKKSEFMQELYQELYKVREKSSAYDGHTFGGMTSFECGVVNINKYTSIYIPLKNRKAIYNSFDLFSCSNKFKKLYKSFIRMAAVILKKNRFTFRGYEAIQLEDSIISWLDRIKSFSFFSLYTGTPGHYRKYTLQLLSEDGSIIGYAKIPRTESAKAAIRNEYNSLVYLNQLKLQNSIIPRTTMFHEENSILVQSAERGLKKSLLQLDDAIIASLSELHNKSKKIIKVSSSNIFTHTSEMSSSNYEKVKWMADSGSKLIEQFGDFKADFSFAHRDFTPWNTKRKDGKIYIYDWEFSKLSMPYFDIFHYIFFVEMLVKKSSKEKIYKIIRNNPFIDKFESLTGLTGRMDMLKLYLLETAYFYYKADTLDRKGLSEDKVLNFTIEMFEYLIGQ